VTDGCVNSEQRIKPKKPDDGVLEGGGLRVTVFDASPAWSCGSTCSYYLMDVCLKSRRTGWPISRLYVHL